MALDIPPKFAKYHKPHTCIYRKDGEVHKNLGCDYKHMVTNVNMKSIEKTRKEV